MGVREGVGVLKLLSISVTKTGGTVGGASFLKKQVGGGCIQEE
jgi:hypothetical protein